MGREDLLSSGESNETPDNTRFISPEEIENMQPFAGSTAQETARGDERGIKPDIDPQMARIVRERGDMGLAMQVSRGDLAWSLKNTRGVDPDVSARVQNTVKNSRMTKGTVSRNLKTAEQIQQEKEVHEVLMERDPGGGYKNETTLRWLMEPNNMALSRDDVKALTELEEIIKVKNADWYDIAGKQLIEGAKDIGRNIAGAAESIQDIVGSAAGISEEDNPVAWYLTRLIPGFGSIVATQSLLGEDSRNAMAATLEQARKSDFLASDYTPFEEAGVKGFERFLYDAARTLPQIGGAVAASALATPFAGAGFVGAHIYGGTYTDLKDQGVSTGRAALSALGNATVQSALEYVGLSRVMKLFRSSGTTQIVNNFLGALLAEGGTEALQSFPESFAKLYGEAELTGASNTEVLQKFVELLPETAKQGLYEGLVVLPFTLFGASAKLGTDAAQNSLVKKEAGLWDRMSGVSEESKLRKRDPDAFEKLIERNLEEKNSEKNIYVSLDKIKESYNQSDIEGVKEFGAVIKKLGVEGQIADAEATGANLEIPIAKWQTHMVGTPVHLSLKNDIAFNSGGVTLNESAEARKELQGKVEEIEAELSEMREENQAPRQILGIRKKLIAGRDKGGLGLSAEDADAQLAVFMAGAGQISKQRGETRQQWFDRVNPTVNIGGEAFVAEQAEGALTQAQAKKARGAVQFTDSQTIINLFDAADRSTFLHETGHVFMKDMGSAIEAGLGDEQFVKDYDTLKEFAGDINSIEGQEKLAGGFEAYLREGKAPSVKLAQAFDKFKNWLTSVYKSLRNLNVNINEEVSAVFDRILASEKEIKEAREYYGVKKSLIDLIKPNAKQKAKVVKAGERADRASEDAQVSKQMKAYVESTGGEQAFRKQAEKDINRASIYKAIEYAENNGSLNAKEIKENYGEGTYNNLKSNHGKLITQKGALSIERLALDNDYTSVDSLISELTSAEKKQDAVDRRTKQLIIKEEAKIRREISSQEKIPGEEALHNDAQLGYLIAEAQVLAEKLSKEQARRSRSLETKTIRAVASESIANRKVSLATRYDLYAKSEQKWAGQYEKAMKEGKIEKAYEARQKQILNHALVQEAVRARDEKVKIENRYSNKKFSSKLKSVENAYAQTSMNLAYAYGLSQLAPKTPGAPVDLVNLDDNLDSMTPTWISSKQKPENFKDYRDLTMGQLRELDTAIKSVMAYGDDKLSSLADDEFKTLTELKDASVKSIYELPMKEVYDEFSIKGRFLNKVDGLLNSTAMMPFIAERLDNYSFTKTNKFGPYRKLVNKVRDAEGNFAELKNKTAELMAPHLETLKGAKKRIEKEMGGGKFQIPGVDVPFIMQSKGRFSWTYDRMLSVILNLGNVGNIESLFDGYNLDWNKVDLITSRFNAKELDAVQQLWGAVDTLYKPLNEVQFKLYNRNLDKVEASPLNLKSSEGEVLLEGGYYPLVFDHLLNENAAKYAEDDLMKNQKAAMFRTSKPEDRFTYSRVPGHGLPPALTLDVMMNHVTQTARYITHAEVLRDVNRLTKNAEWREAVKDRTGVKRVDGDIKPLYDYVRDWVHFQARPSRGIKGSGGKFLEAQRRLATGAILGLNLSVGLKQRLSMFNAVRAIGWKAVLDGYRSTDLRNSALGLRSSDKWQKIMDTSPYMKARAAGAISREIYDTVDNMKPFAKTFKLGGKDFTWNDVKSFMFEWIRMNDRATVGPVWMGAFNKYISENENMSDRGKLNENAISYADSIVQSTQPSSLPVDMNALQHSEGWMRLFTSFMTYTFKWGNILQETNRAYWKDGAISTKEYARHMLYETLMSPYGAMALTTVLATGEMPKWWEWFTYPLEFLTSWVPFGRDIAGSFKYGGDVGQSPAFEGINRTLKAGKSVKAWAEGDKDFSKAMWDVGRAAELFAGVPALSVVKQLDNSYNIATGGKKK